VQSGNHSPLERFAIRKEGTVRAMSDVILSVSLVVLYSVESSISAALDVLNDLHIIPFKEVPL